MINKEVVELKIEIAEKLIGVMGKLPDVVTGLAFDASDEDRRIASNDLLGAIKLLNDINEECLVVED